MVLHGLVAADDKGFCIPQNYSQLSFSHYFSTPCAVFLKGETLSPFS